MHKPLADRLLILFVLEVSLLLCVLRLTDSPLSAAMTATSWAGVLFAGAVILLVGMLGPRFARRSGALHGSVGVVLFVSGLYCEWTNSGDAAGNLALACLGLIVAVTGLKGSPRRPILAG